MSSNGDLAAAQHRLPPRPPKATRRPKFEAAAPSSARLPSVRAQFLRSSRAPASPSLMGRDRFAEALADAREQIQVLRKALDAAGAARCAILVVDAVDAEKDAAPRPPLGRRAAVAARAVGRDVLRRPKPDAAAAVADAVAAAAAGAAPRRAARSNSTRRSCGRRRWRSRRRRGRCRSRPAQAPRVARACLTLQQPYASLLMRGEKTLETRMTDFLKAHEGTELLIHVGHPPAASGPTTGSSSPAASAAALAEVAAAARHAEGHDRRRRPRRPHDPRRRARRRRRLGGGRAGGGARAARAPQEGLRHRDQVAALAAPRRRRHADRQGRVDRRHDLRRPATFAPSGSNRTFA